MLPKCSSVLLLTDNKSFGEVYKNLAECCDIEMEVRNEWNKNYRIRQEEVICEDKYLSDINKAYFESIVLILKEEDSIVPYIKDGINRFIFDIHNQQELIFALYNREKKLIVSKGTDLKTILTSTNSSSYVCGDYDFHFDTGKFFWKKRPIYLSEANKKYLAEWLLNGNKDNKKRVSLYNLRQRLGNDFLKDVNRFGELKCLKEKK